MKGWRDGCNTGIELLHEVVCSVTEYASTSIMERLEDQVYRHLVGMPLVAQSAQARTSVCRTSKNYVV